MIAYLDGVVSEVRDSSVIVQAGVFGLEVFAPKATLMACSVGSALRLHTYLAVKEDDLTLYGFHDGDMRRMFAYLISVSGVGPKLGLAILSALPTTLLAGAIVQGDAGLLSSAPGVGKKLAERIILELKGRLPEELLVAEGSSRPQAVMGEAGNDAVEALLALGYRESQVKSAVAELSLKDPDATAETLIRKALAKLR
ncbi:MAG: Holliday junction branch migration protein RuvA [Trueperaceae bacterium]|nr:Holliday junction branch migration protein RuvA [Trueperaceae bacterium]